MLIPSLFRLKNIFLSLALNVVLILIFFITLLRFSFESSSGCIVLIYFVPILIFSAVLSLKHVECFFIIRSFVYKNSTVPKFHNWLFGFCRICFFSWEHFASKTVKTVGKCNREIKKNKFIISMLFIFVTKNLQMLLLLWSIKTSTKFLLIFSLNFLRNGGVHFRILW